MARPPPKIENLDGVWHGDLVLSIDQCFFDRNLTSENHKISIDGDAVTLTLTDGRVLKGQATSSNGFTVENMDTTSFPIGYQISYSNIENGHAHVEMSFIRNLGLGGCMTTWSGEMIRK